MTGVTGVTSVSGKRLGRWSAVNLLDRHAPEDPVLGAIELPRSFDIAWLLLITGVVATAATASLLLDDGDDRFNLLASALVAVPIAWWMVRDWRCRPNAGAAPWVLVPAASLAVVELAIGDRSLGFAPQLLLFLCLLMLVECAFAPRRQATLVVVATYAVFVLRAFASPDPALMLVPWTTALSFCVAGIVGIRAGALGIARSQQAVAERAALDERGRIARGFHDVVAHTLAVTMRRVTAARRAIAGSAVAAAVDALEEAERQGRASLADIRRTIRVLRSDDGGPGPTAPPVTAGAPEASEMPESPDLPDGSGGPGPADTDALLAGLELPPPVVWGGRAVAVLAALVAVVGTLVVDRHDQAATVLLIGAMLLPWLLDAVGVPIPGALFATMVLGPPALQIVVELLTAGSGAWRESDGYEFGSSSSVYLVMLSLLALSFGPRRVLAVAATAALVIYGVRGLLQDSVFALMIWPLALLATSAACVGVRIGAVGVARAQRAAVGRAAADRRRQIARDIHDVVAHTLAVTMLHITAARMALLRADIPAATEALEEADRSGRSSLDDVRRMTRLLRAGDESTVTAARPTLADIPALVDSYGAAGLAIGTVVAGPLDAVAPVAGPCLYRVAQEALANAARHGDGSATVDLRVADGAVVLEVRNALPPAAPAPPAPPSSPSSPAGGSGIGGMRERVAAVGGTLTAGPTGDGRHWQVRAEVVAG